MTYSENRNIILASLLFSIIVALSLQYFFYSIFILLIFTLLYFKSDYYPYFFLAVLLIITSDISDIIRLEVNAAGILFFFLLFLKKYGLQFDRYPKMPKNFLWFCSLIFFSMIMSTAASEYAFEAVPEVLRQLIFFILIYLFYSFFNSLKDINRYLTALVFTGTMIGLSVFYVFVTSDAAVNLLLSEGLLHQGGYFKNVSAAGGLFVITICVTLSLFIGGETKAVKVWLFISLLIQLAGLFLTNSRAAVLGVIIGIFYILFKLKKISRKMVAGTLSGFLIFFLLMYDQIISWISIYFRVGRVFENTRFYLWDISYSIIRDYPLFGVGPGAYKFYMYKYLPVSLGSWDESQLLYIYQNAGLGHQHNYFLFKATELGILGIITAIILPVLYFYYSYKTLNMIKNNNLANSNNGKKYYAVVSGFIGIGYGMLIRSIYESTGLLSYGWITRDLPFWIVLVIVIFLYRKLNSNPMFITQSQ